MQKVVTKRTLLLTAVAGALLSCGVVWGISRGSIAHSQPAETRALVQEYAIGGASSAAKPAPNSQDQSALQARVVPVPARPGAMNEPDPTSTPTPVPPAPPIKGQNPPSTAPTATPVPPTPSPPQAPTIPFVPPLSLPLGSLVDQASLPALLYQALNAGALSASTSANAPVIGQPVLQDNIPALLAGTTNSKVPATSAAQNPVLGQPVQQDDIPAMLAQANAKGGLPPNQPGPAGLAAPTASQVQGSAVVPQTLVAVPAACDSFSSAKVRDWCKNPTEATLTCADFPPGTGEATRFTRTSDPDDVNGLDKDGDLRSCSDK